MRTSRKVLLGVIVLLVLVLAAALSTQGRRGRGVEVRVEEVTKRDLVATVTASGNVRARRKVDISSDISARVTSLLIEEGNEVEEGQVLLRLDPSQYQASLARSQATFSQAQAQVAQARANFQRAERDHLRMVNLRGRDSLLVSRQDVENAETDLDVQRSLLEAADFGVNQARAAVDEAQDQLSKTIIRAPISGKVTRLNVEQGETVIVGTMNNAGSLILTISDLSIMEVVLEVDETDVPEIALNDSALVELDAFPNLEFTGTVTEIGNSAIRPPSEAASTGQTPTIDFEVIVTLADPPAELRPDLSATADVITDVRDQQLGIPIISLTIREEDRVSPNDSDDEGRGAGTDEQDAGPLSRADVPEPVEGVFVFNGESVSFVPVEVGIAGQEYFEVLSGLSEGDQVVSGPYQIIRTLADGDAVTTGEGDAAEEEAN
ncbi:MAG: efflux RND transporter periplasmic adaptor subunit [Longimicrobiales bacterium]